MRKEFFQHTRHKENDGKRCDRRQAQSVEHDLWMYQKKETEEAKRLQGARKPRKDEEMAWAPPRNKSEWPSWEEATKTVESEWRLEPEGEAEVPGTIIVSDAVEGSFVDLDGGSRREQVEANLSGRGRGEKHQAKGVRRLKSEKESESGGIRRNTGLCERVRNMRKRKRGPSYPAR